MCCLDRVSFYRTLTMEIRKYKFMDEIKRKYSRFQNGRDELEAECLVCKPETYMPVVNKGALDFEPTWNARSMRKLLEVT